MEVNVFQEYIHINGLHLDPKPYGEKNRPRVCTHFWGFFCFVLSDYETCWVMTQQVILFPMLQNSWQLQLHCSTHACNSQLLAAAFIHTKLYHFPLRSMWIWFIYYTMQSHKYLKVFFTLLQIIHLTLWRGILV